MRLHEIEKLYNFDKERDSEEFLRYEERIEVAEVIGKLGKYDIRRWIRDNGKGMLIGIYDKNEEYGTSVLGVIELHKEKQAWQTNYTMLHDELQGQGIMPYMYKFLIVDYDMTLISDEQQSDGGQYIWKKLFKMPGVNVYAMRHVFGRKPQFSSVGLNDFDDLEGVFDVYDHYDDERGYSASTRYSELEKEFKAGKMTKDEYDIAVDQVEQDDMNMDNEDEEQEYANRNTFLVATKK